MSSAASISAAKKRRANQLQTMPLQPQPQQQQQQQQQPQLQQRPMPASLANLSPAQRQQFLQQQQQLHQQQIQQQQQQQQQQQSRMQQGQGQGQKPQTGQTQKPGLTWPVPPIYLMKQMDTMLFQQSQSIDDIKNRLNCIESGSLSGSGLPESGFGLEQIKPALMSDEEFVAGIVDNIMTNSNLSEIIEQIDAVQTENQELRELFYAQQKTINEMNLMLVKMFSQGLYSPPVTATPVTATPVASVIPSNIPIPVLAPVTVIIPSNQVASDENEEIKLEVSFD